MLIDIFDNNNSITVNYKTIQIFGLPTAVYLTELVNIYKKAVKKGKVNEYDYFKVDRKYISNLISLTSEEQIICDLNLVKTSVLKKDPNDPDLLKLDIKLFLSLLSSEDFSVYENIKKQMRVSKPKGIKASQRQQMINGLKESIECSNYELLTALREWVDGVYSRPNGFLSKSAIKIFQDTLNNYTKGDLDLALRVVQIATVQGYRDCTWAINMLEESEKRKRQVARNSIRVTEQRVATKKDLSNDVF